MAPGSVSRPVNIILFHIREIFLAYNATYLIALIYYHERKTYRILINTLSRQTALENPTKNNVIPMGKRCKYRHERVNNISYTSFHENEKLLIFNTVLVTQCVVNENVYPIFHTTLQCWVSLFTIRKC